MRSWYEIEFLAKKKDWYDAERERLRKEGKEWFLAAKEYIQILSSETHGPTHERLLCFREEFLSPKNGWDESCSDFLLMYFARQLERSERDEIKQSEHIEKGKL